MSQSNSEIYDVVVVGSGAGGFVAALSAQLLGLSVLIVEKTSKFGGTSALSGGVLWIPMNNAAQAAGITDDLDSVRAYLRHELGNHYDATMIDAYLNSGTEMVDFLEARTEVAFEKLALPDYHPANPGAGTFRSIRAITYDGRALGKRFADLRAPIPETMLFSKMMLGGEDIYHIFKVFRSVRSFTHVANLIIGYARDRITASRGLRLCNGNALVARLAKSAFDAGVTLWLNAKVSDLGTDGSRVTGVAVERDGQSITVEARCGVVLATGGFPKDTARLAKHLSHMTRGHQTIAAEGSTGDGITLAESIGGRLKTDLDWPTALIPLSRVPRDDGTTGMFPHLIDRGKPGMIAVTMAGTRFVNESNSYHDFVEALVAACPDTEVVSFLICDQRAMRAYGLGAARAWPIPVGPWLRNGYLMRADTIEGLAQRLGIEPMALTRTVADYNADAENGVDRAFGKGGNIYNLAFGDPAWKPNPCIAPVIKPPFYAVKIIAGDLATLAGIETDADARVLRDGTPVEGLFAVGTDAATILGGGYPGPGMALGPAMTFGYRAARTLIEQK